MLPVTRIHLKEIENTRKNGYLFSLEQLRKVNKITITTYKVILPDGK